MSKDNRLLELLREVRDYLWRLGALKARIEQLDEAIKIVEAGVIRHGNTGAYLGNGVLTVGKGANDRPYLCLDVSTPEPEVVASDFDRELADVAFHSMNGTGGTVEHVIAAAALAIAKRRKDAANEA